MHAAGKQADTTGNFGYNILNQKMNELLDLMSMHLATTSTQIDIKQEVLGLLSEEVRQMIEVDFTRAVIKIDFSSEEEGNQCKFNWLVLELARQLNLYTSSNNDLDDLVGLKPFDKLCKAVFNQMFLHL